MAKATAKPEKPLPKSDAAKADLLYQTRQERYRLQHQIEELEKLEGRIEEYFINHLPAGQTGLAGTIARVQVETKPVPTVEDWAKLYQYIKRTGAFELLQRRLTKSAVEERWEDKKTIPGVGRFNAKSVSVTKIGGK
jgi:hypothetical protein